RRQQAFRHHRDTRRAAGRAQAQAGAIPVPEFLGPHGRPALHAVDRPVRGGSPAGPPAGLDPGVPAAPRLRPPAARPAGLRLAEADAWFAYPYWLDDGLAPDFARTVNIHAKPGYDPCELFFDPKLWWPKGRALWRLLQKKLGFRTLFDVVPLDAGLVKGSHGLPAADALNRPVLLGDGPAPTEAELPMTAVRDRVL